MTISFDIMKQNKEIVYSGSTQISMEDLGNIKFYEELIEQAILQIQEFNQESDRGFDTDVAKSVLEEGGAVGLFLPKLDTHTGRLTLEGRVFMEDEISKNRKHDYTQKFDFSKLFFVTSFKISNFYEDIITKLKR